MSQLQQLQLEQMRQLHQQQRQQLQQQNQKYFRQRKMKAPQPGNIVHNPVNSRKLGLPQVDILMDRKVDPKGSLIAMVIDRSGSMASMGCEVEGGCNAYLDEQRRTDAANGFTTNILFSTFDTVIKNIHNGVSLTSVPAITRQDVSPGGGTALYDGIGDTLLKTAAFLNKQEKLPGKIVIFILTDGAENSSREWNAASVTAEIKRLSEAPYNFEFYFAAANQDALQAGARMGIPRTQCLDFDPTPYSMEQTMKTCSAVHSRSKQSGQKGTAFTPEERARTSSKVRSDNN